VNRMKGVPAAKVIADQTIGGLRPNRSEIGPPKKVVKSDPNIVAATSEDI